jgi:hypothetical protein
MKDKINLLSTEGGRILLEFQGVEYVIYVNNSNELAVNAADGCILVMPQASNSIVIKKGN